MAEEMKNVSEKVRYSDEELQEFKAIIIEMLEKAKKEYKHLRNIITHDESNDIEDTSPTFKVMEEGDSFKGGGRCACAAPVQVYPEP